MANNKKITTISLPIPIKRLGKKASESIYFSKFKFSAYVQDLIIKDCKERGIK